MLACMLNNYTHSNLINSTTFQPDVCFFFRHYYSTIYRYPLLPIIPIQIICHATKVRISLTLASIIFANTDNTDWSNNDLNYEYGQLIGTALLQKLLGSK